MFRNISQLFRGLTGLLHAPRANNKTRPLQKTSLGHRPLVEELEARTLLNSNFSLAMGGGAKTIDSPPPALFTAHGPAWQAALQANADAVLTLPGAAPGSTTPVESTLRLHFVGANRNVRPIGMKLREGGAFTNNALPGQPEFEKASFRNVYPGIDVVYQLKRNHLEFVFVVHPGANPRQIVLAYQGAQGVKLDAQGNVIVRLPSGSIVQQAPYLFQTINGVRREIPGQYQLDAKGRLYFQIGRYNLGRPLVIDPEINNPPTANNDSYTVLHDQVLIATNSDAGRTDVLFNVTPT